ncbi:MAG: AAA family ATPase [Acidimicrobiia bacterium]
MLIGRDAELAHLAAALDAACLGTTTALVIEGEPGVGKTALLAAAATLAASATARVFVTAGDEFSARPYGVVGDLVASGAALQRLDRQHRAAIDAAVGLGGITSTAAIAGAFVALLAETAAEAPAVLLVDDLHWVDAASLELLRYAFDRLEADRLALVATVRTDTTNPLAALAKATTLPLPPLASDDAKALLHSTAMPLTDDVVARLVDGAGDNPLGLLTAARLLTASQRTGAAPLPDPLTAGPRLTNAFRASIDALAASTQVALVVVAAAGAVASDTLSNALTGCGLSLADLASAIDDELLTDGLAFRHPLIRAAAYHGASREVRTQAHRALAAAARTSGDEIGLASHLLAIADVPDDDAAIAALRAAQLLFERGLANQAGAMARDASCSPTDDNGTKPLSSRSDSSWSAAGSPMSSTSRMASSPATGPACSPRRRSSCEVVANRGRWARRKRPSCWKRAVPRRSRPTRRMPFST